MIELSQPGILCELCRDCSIHKPFTSTAHLRSDIHPHSHSMQIKDLGAKAGVVLNPGTPLDSIEYVLDVVDLILIMSGKSLSF